MLHSSVIIAAAIVSVGFKFVKVLFLRREKLVYGEAQFVKQVTRVVVCGGNALVLRNAEVDYRNKELNISFQSYDSKQTDGYKHFSDVVAVNDDVVKHTAYALRNGIYVHLSAAAATLCGFYHFCGKANGVNHFCLCQLFCRRSAST